MSREQALANYYMVKEASIPSKALKHFDKMKRMSPDQQKHIMKMLRLTPGEEAGLMKALSSKSSVRGLSLDPRKANQAVIIPPR